MQQYQEAKFPVINLSDEDKELGTVEDVLKKHGIEFAIGLWPEMLVWTINGTMIMCDWASAITPIERNDLSICVLGVPDFVADLKEDANCVRQSALQIPRSITDTYHRSLGAAEGLTLRAGSS